MNRIGERVARTKAELGEALRPNSFTYLIDSPGGIVYRDGRNVSLSKVLTVNVQGLTFPYADGDTHWKPGDPYIDITVPLRFKRRYTPEAINHSIRQLARYATYNALHQQEDLRVVGSVTHRPFASYVQRAVGSTVKIAAIEEENLPVESVDGALRICDLTVGDATPRQRRAVFAYSTLADILEPFIGEDPEITGWYLDPPNRPLMPSFDPVTGMPQQP